MISRSFSFFSSSRNSRGFDGRLPALERSMSQVLRGPGNLESRHATPQYDVWSLFFAVTAELFNRTTI